MTRVVDGDTIHVRIGGHDETVRYIGMNTPETVKPGSPLEPYGAEASAANSRLVAGRRVVLEKDVSERDQYGRLLRDVWVADGSTMILVDFQLVVRGYATVTTFPPDVKYAAQLLVAQRWARERSAGLWGLGAAATAAPQPGGPGALPSSARPPVGFVSNCDPSYPDRCIPPPPPDLQCSDIAHRVRVLPPDPHHLDGDHNGFGCEMYPP